MDNHGLVDGVYARLAAAVRTSGCRWVGVALLTLALVPTADYAWGFPERDREIGAREHPRLVAQLDGVFKADPGLLAYVNELGGRLTARSEYGDQTWTFTVLESAFPNAFALPGGYIYLTRGLLTLVRSESELAAVLAHEIAHVAARHSLAGQARVTAANAGRLDPALPGEDRARGGVSPETGMRRVLALYSQQDEFEADELAIEYLRRAGFDPRAVPQVLRAHEAHAALVGADSGPVNQMLSSHPSTPERMRRSADLADRAGWQPIADRDDGFLDRIHGLPFGERPRAGLVRGREIFLAGPEIRFRMPDEFRVRREPRRIIARASDGTIIVYDEIFAKSWQTGILGYLPSGSRDVELLRLDGMDAATGIRIRERGSRRFEFRTLVIYCTTSVVCRFRYAVPLEVSLARRGDVRETALSFRRFNDKDRLAARPQTIRIATVRAVDTLESLVARMDVDGDADAWFRLLNGLQPGEMLPVGARVKLVVR